MKKHEEREVPDPRQSIEEIPTVNFLLVSSKSLQSTDIAQSSGNCGPVAPPPPRKRKKSYVEMMRRRLPADYYLRILIRSA